MIAQPRSRDCSRVEGPTRTCGRVRRYGACGLVTDTTDATVTRVATRLRTVWRYRALMVGIALLLTQPSHAGAVERGTGDEPPLTAAEIYQRVLKNRLGAFSLTGRLLSTDRGGNSQVSEFEMWHQSFKQDSSPGREDGVLSRSLLRYTHPFDLRHSAYLLLENRDRPDDQFIYRSSIDRIRRVNLRGVAIFGSDFSVEDIVPSEFESADFQLLARQPYHGIECHIVRAIVSDAVAS